MDADWSREFLHQSGVLTQGASPWGKAACVDLRDAVLLLSPLPGPRYPGPPLVPGHPATFQVTSPAGIFRATGTYLGARPIAINGVPQEVLQLEVGPGGVERLNRRAHYRVAVNLKGEIAFFADEDLSAAGLAPPRKGAPPSNLEAVAEAVARERRPCLVRELGLGGARAATLPPAPGARTCFLLDLALEPGERLCNLSGRVLEILHGSGPAPLHAQLRLRFDRPAGATEARLSRHLAQVQVELLKKGIRS